MLRIMHDDTTELFLLDVHFCLKANVADLLAVFTILYKRLSLSLVRPMRSKIFIWAAMVVLVRNSERAYLSAY